MRQEDIDRAKQFWDQTDADKVRNVSWTAIRYFEEQIARRLTKSREGWGIHPLANASASFVSEMLTSRVSEESRESLIGCALVCGDMEGERLYFESASRVRFCEVHGYDLSSKSLARYDPKGIKFHAHIMDCNDLTLERERFHLIVGSHGIHHVMNVGGLFYQAHKAMAPGGLILLHEWIGPNFLQIPWTNRWIARVLLYTLFPKRASRTMQDGIMKGRWIMPPPEDLEPSEACNSEDLWHQYVRFFRPLHSVFYGGLLFPIFDGLGHLFNTDRWTHRIRIRIVYALERGLTKLRVIQPLFVTTIGEKR